MNIVVMGTADFAVPTLKRIHESNRHQVLAVVTAPDKLGGRGRKQLISSPVKQYAVEANIPVLQPDKLRDDEFITELRELKADIFVVVAFRMLPEVIWSMPQKGTINLHGSLLPKYRGAAPINWAIIKGEEETGVTTFLIDKEIDTGKILFQAKETILPEDNVQSLYNRLQELGAALMMTTLDAIESDNYTPLLQSEEAATHAPKIFKESCQIDIENSCVDIHNFIRGLAPHPGAWMIWNDSELKIFETELAPDIFPTNVKPGQLWLQGKNELMLQCKDGALSIKEAQIQGKKRMSAIEIINGYRNILSPNL